ncbi:MAG: TlpA family protein disulfide reductase [Planctomycetes bacterium]|nr:TlpA family protein disulfide reductase [Planctomycetota bacterium]
MMIAILKGIKSKTTFFTSLSVFFILIFLTSPNDTTGSQPILTIEGTVTNIPPSLPNSIYLYSYYGNELTEEASSPVNEQGVFRFEMKSILPQGLYKIGLDQTNAASLVISGEEFISVKADYGELKNDTIAVTNSRENEAYRVLLDEWKRMGSKMVRLTVEKSQISTVDPFFVRKTETIEDNVRLIMQEHNVNLLSIKETYPGTFMSDVLVGLSRIPLRIDHPDLKDRYDNERAFMHDYFFEFIGFGEERIVFTPLLAKKYFTYLDQYTHHTTQGFKESVDFLLAKAEDNSTVYEFTIQYLMDTFREKGLPKLAEYVLDAYEEGCHNPLSTKTADKIEKLKRLRVGQVAPEIVSENPDGKTIPLSSLIGKKVVMVYIWASWCEGCEAENPHIVSLYNTFKERGLDIYAVALDKEREEWLRAIRKHKFTWTNVSDLREWESEAVETYQVNRTPTIYLLNREGRIMAKNLRGRELEMKVTELLK